MRKAEEYLAIAFSAMLILLSTGSLSFAHAKVADSSIADRALLCARPSGRSADLDALEERFFETTYPTDTTDARLERLEKLVFGEAKQGSVQERLASLLAAVPALPAATGTSSVSAPGPAASAAAVATASTASTPVSNGASSASGDGDGAVPDSSDYPSVTQLESEILGATYRNEPIKRRLGQLETKAFGKPSSDDDLSARVALLQQYADRRNLVPGRNYAPQPVPVSGAPPGADAPLETKVSWLEQQVFGSAQPQRSLLERVNRLDHAIYPSQAQPLGDSLGENVEALVSAVELSAAQPHQSAAARYPAGSGPSYQSSYPSTSGYGTAPYYPSSYAPNPTYPAASSYGATYPASAAQPYTASQSNAPAQESTNQHSAPKEHPLLHGLAHVLGAVGSMAMSSVGSGYGMPGMGYGVPGMGYGW